jgi:hypothetical protein
MGNLALMAIADERVGYADGMFIFRQGMVG